MIKIIYKYWLLITVILAQGASLLAQNNYPLSGEGNIDHVKLFWLPKIWDKNDIGYIIKRREVKENGNKLGWTDIMKNPIIPECSLSKNLENIEPLSNERDRLKARLEYFLSKEDPYIKLSEVTNEEYINYIVDTAKLKGLSLLFYKDFDIALLHGFACIDRNVPEAYAYEYGLFRVNNEGNEFLENVFYWTYGTKDSLNIDMDTEYRIQKRKKKIKMKWTFDADLYFLNKDVAGFDIFKRIPGEEYHKINKTRLVVGRDKKNQATIFYTDLISDDTLSFLYAVAPISLFNSIGEYNAIDVQLVPNIENMEITEFKIENKQDDYEKEGLNFSWHLDTVFNKQVKQFALIKTTQEGGIDTVMSNITPDERTLNISADGLEYSELVSFYLIAEIYNSDNIESNEASLVHFKNPESAYDISITPFQDDSGDIYLKINWKLDSPELKTWLYQSRINLPDSNLLLAVDSALTGTEYNFYAGNSGNDTYNFSLVTMDSRGERSTFSDMVLFTIPNYEYGRVFISNLELVNNEVKVSWKFPEYKDIKGYRIFNNGNQLLNEDQLNGELRSTRLRNLPSGKNEISIQAVSVYGVESEVSPGKKIEIP